MHWILDVFSHTLDLIGKNFSTPVLSDFYTLWLSLFSHSPKTKMLWKEQTGRAMPTFSKTRWWSRWEVLHHIMLLFGDVKPFLTKNSDIGPSLRPKLLDMLHHLPTVIQWKVELAIVIDFGEQFVKSTYNLEGDGALIVTCYEEILKLQALVHSSYYQNLEAVIQSFSQGNAIIQHQWKSHAFSCIKPGIDYFNDKFGSDTACPLNAFKASRLFSFEGF